MFTEIICNKIYEYNFSAICETQNTFAEGNIRRYSSDKVIWFHSDSILFSN